MITVYTMAFNEEVFLQFMIEHYRKRFPGCRIVVHDNESTDKTAEIARQNGCEVVLYCSDGQVNDEKLKALKSNFWKDAQTDWVVVCDVDELLEIDEKSLVFEQSQGTSIVSTEGYTLVNMHDDFSFSEMKYGQRDSWYDKPCLFNRRLLREINYQAGAHKCCPEGEVKWSEAKYRLYHYKYVNPDLQIKKNRYTLDRLSEVNKQHGWGALQWRDVDDEQVRKMFSDLRSRATRVVLP
jgi:glycosyltransferase involved in cell wall biosynthesis